METKMNRPLCIYHGNCADGFTAAWAVWKRFGDEFEYYPGVYQNPPPDVAGRDVVFVDFSYKRAVLEELAKSARSILVLDHHKSAEADLKGLGVDMSGWSGALAWGRYLDCVAQDHMENANINGAIIYQLFDMERSGAGLAWDFFHGGERPPLVLYVEDRDLWRFKLLHSRAVNAFIFSHEYTFENWAEINDLMISDPGAVIGAGAAIERKHHKDIAELVKVTKRSMTIGGHTVPVANLPYTLTSDAGHLMCETWNGDMMQDGVTAAWPPFAACYWDTPEGRVFSLRSLPDGADVSEIAKQYGGGGHKNAAGFRVPFGHELAR